MTRSDRDHLRTLSTCHYVLGGLCFLVGCFPFFHLVLGIVIVNGGFGPQQANTDAGPPPEFLGWLLIGIGSLLIAFHWALGLALVHAGSCLRRRTGRVFCIVVAGFACLFQPLGTVLGVFTLIVLTRPTVRDAFDLTRADFAEPDDHDRYR